MTQTRTVEVPSLTVRQVYPDGVSLFFTGPGTVENVRMVQRICERIEEEIRG